MNVATSKFLSAWKIYVLDGKILYTYVLRVCLRFIELTYVNEFHIKSTYTKAWSRGLWASYSRDFNNNYLKLLAQLVLYYNRNRLTWSMICTSANIYLVILYILSNETQHPQQLFPTHCNDITSLLQHQSADIFLW